MFGLLLLFVDGKLCMGVKGEECWCACRQIAMASFRDAEHPRTRPAAACKAGFWVEPNGYATRAQWSFWLDEALAYNPRAKASPRCKPTPAKTVANTAPRQRPKDNHHAEGAIRKNGQRANGTAFLTRTTDAEQSQSKGLQRFIQQAPAATNSIAITFHFTLDRPQETTHENRIHRPRQHGRPHGTQPAQGRPRSPRV